LALYLIKTNSIIKVDVQKYTADNAQLNTAIKTGMV